MVFSVLMIVMIVDIVMMSDGYIDYVYIYDKSTFLMKGNTCE